jgi:hypothetical protein
MAAARKTISVAVRADSRVVIDLGGFRGCHPGGGQQHACRAQQLQHTGHGHQQTGRGQSGRHDGDEIAAQRRCEMRNPGQHEHRRQPDGDRRGPVVDIADTKPAGDPSHHATHQQSDQRSHFNTPI